MSGPVLLDNVDHHDLRVAAWRARSTRRRCSRQSRGIVPRGRHLLPSTLPTPQLQTALAELRCGITATLARLPTRAQFAERYAQVPQMANDKERMTDEP